MESGGGWVNDIEGVVDAAEKLYEFWDETGLDMKFAVCPNAGKAERGTLRIAISTTHWFRVNYVICQDVTLEEIWGVFKRVGEKIGRTFVKHRDGTWMYIHKLNREQTEGVYNCLLENLESLRVDYSIERHWEFNWEIEGARLPGLTK